MNECIRNNGYKHKYIPVGYKNIRFQKSNSLSETSTLDCTNIETKTNNSLSDSSGNYTSSKKSELLTDTNIEPILNIKESNGLSTYNGLTQKPLDSVLIPKEKTEVTNKKRLNLEEYLKRRSGFKENVSETLIKKQNVNDTLTHVVNAVANHTDGYSEKRQSYQHNLDEIVIVSAGTNTELSLPPNSILEDSGLNPDVSNILKSNYLLKNINNTIISTNGDNIKISSNSLIASIQDVLIRKFKPNPIESKNDPENIDDHFGPKMEHGEDKVIMYLRKDRQKIATKSVECQTNNLLHFPMLKSQLNSNLLTKTEKEIYKSNSSERFYRSHYSISSNYKDRKRTINNSDSSLSSPHKNRHYMYRSSDSIDIKRHKSGKYSRRRITSSQNESLSRSESDSSESESLRQLSSSCAETSSSMVRNPNRRRFNNKIGNCPKIYQLWYCDCT